MSKPIVHGDRIDRRTTLERYHDWLKQLEYTFEHLLFCDELGPWDQKTGYDWTYPEDREPQSTPYTYKYKAFSIGTSYGDVRFEISVRGEEYDETIDINISQVLGSIHHEGTYSWDDKVGMVTCHAVRFMLNEFAHNRRKRYFAHDVIDEHAEQQ